MISLSWSLFYTTSVLSWQKLEFGQLRLINVIMLKG